MSRAVLETSLWPEISSLKHSNQWLLEIREQGGRGHLEERLDSVVAFFFSPLFSII